MRQVAQVVGEADRLPEAAEIFAAWRARADMGEFGILLGHLAAIIGAVSCLQKRSPGNHDRPPFNVEGRRSAPCAKLHTSSACARQRIPEEFSPPEMMMSFERSFSSI